MPPPVITRRESLWAPMRRAIGRLGLGLTVSAAPALAQGEAVPSVPLHWSRYAEWVSQQFQARLSDPNNEAVLRLHGWMQAGVPLQPQAAREPSLVLRVWIAPTGEVARLAFDSLGNLLADGDLRSLITAEPLAKPPPQDMLQPMVLQLALGAPHFE
ncbi:hypothetical protein [Hydrogenophaga palleronii]|uniref:hypothetical protein n=1 Tax=Hydrogenophaga palleronii TaxID=65655 RepID=UPI000825ECD9|nr:hypothetical protein [Hydrogenophaga palleronii]